jgi:hypothetical protein
MPTRKDPASQVVEFFESASIETAQTVLAICKSVVARRAPKGAPRRAAKPKREATAEPTREG